MSLVTEFRDFINRGNVVDLAVGVIIGAAFGKIVSSLVADVIMPPVGLILGGLDFSNIAITLKAATGGDPKTAVVMKIGVFINTVIDFLIVGFCIFMVVKAVNRMKKKEAEKPEEPAKPTPSETLLGEIRDLLKARK
jgi:large conductance mechanosensitive channel